MRCPTLDELPRVAGKTGWPWTEAGSLLPPTMPDGGPWPRISIVTPNYNYGRFLEETLRSVLLQGYPDVELIVMDGGSTDESVEILEKYSRWLTYWVSERDGGHVDAIHKGLARVTGEWFNWLNSDDLLWKGALETVATISRLAPQAQWITGATLFLTESGAPVDYHVPWRTDPTVLGFGWPNFPQDATFVRPDWLQRRGVRLAPGVGIFDTLFHWDLIAHALPVVTPACLSAMRLHAGQVHGDPERRGREIERFLKEKRRTLMPAWTRGWYRFLKTRKTSSLFRHLLALANWYGVTPGSRFWQAAVYHRWQHRWHLVPARRAVLY